MLKSLNINYQVYCMWATVTIKRNYKIIFSFTIHFFRVTLNNLIMGGFLKQIFIWVKIVKGEHSNESWRVKLIQTKILNEKFSSAFVLKIIKMFTFQPICACIDVCLYERMPKNYFLHFFLMCEKVFSSFIIKMMLSRSQSSWIKIDKFFLTFLFHNH